MKTKDIVTNALMVALLIVASQLAIPSQPVPISLQTLATMLIAIFRPPKQAFYVMLAYLTLGLIGLPVFSNFSGSLSSILSPSFGFILSWLIACPLQSLYLEKRIQLDLKYIFLSNLINFVTTYLIGIPYMAIILNLYLNQGLGFSTILMAGLIPFLPGDILKILIATLIGKRLYPRFRPLSTDRKRS